MSLTMRQRMLVHIVVQRFDRESQTTVLEPGSLSKEVSASTEDLRADIDVLVLEGYLTRPEGVDADATPWVVEPTDRAVLSAMGLE